VITALLAGLEAIYGHSSVSVMKKYRGGADVRSDIDDPARPKML
jgi:hypothetical protein